MTALETEFYVFFFPTNLKQLKLQSFSRVLTLGNSQNEDKEDFLIELGNNSLVLVGWIKEGKEHSLQIASQKSKLFAADLQGQPLLVESGQSGPGQAFRLS